MEVASFVILAQTGSPKRPVRSLCKPSRPVDLSSLLLHPLLRRTRQPYRVPCSWRDGPKTARAQLPHKDQTYSMGGSDACEEQPIHPPYFDKLFRPLKLSTSSPGSKYDRQAKEQKTKPHESYTNYPVNRNRTGVQTNPKWHRKVRSSLYSPLLMQTIRPHVFIIIIIVFYLFTCCLCLTIFLQFHPRSMLLVFYLCLSIFPLPSFFLTILLPFIHVIHALLLSSHLSSFSLLFFFGTFSLYVAHL